MEWDILFHPASGADPLPSTGDIVAHRTVRRARHSRTTVVAGDSHPVILRATDVLLAEADSVWRHVLGSVEQGGTISDVRYEYRHPGK